MKSPGPGSRRKKIILYYTLAVVLPGIILGYLAYRGIRNDQALREKESLKRLELSSQAFFNEIDSDFIQFTNKNNSGQLLSGHKVADPSILAMVVRDSGGSRKLIAHQLLYLPVDLLPQRPEQLRQPASLKEGIRLEFSERRYPEAFRSYQDILKKTKDPSEKIQVLVASARLYNKLGQPDRAKDLYEMVMKDYSGSLLNGQIPLALIASLEILKINKSLGEDDEMKDNAMKYLDLLLHPPSEYTVDQFDMFYQSFKEIIPGNNPVTDSLFLELDTRRIRTDFLIRILSQPDLILSGSNNRSGIDKNGLSVIPINSAELDGAYLTWKNPDEKQTVMVIDFPVYLKSVSDDLVKKLDKGSSVSIKVEDDNGKIIISNVPGDEAISYLSFPFPENLPDWKLLLSENKPGFIATLLKAGSGLYLFIFILIALFMILGFVFIMYTLNVELRLNKLKSEFISNVSHELKSPLTSIRMMTEMLHNNRVGTEERKSAYYEAMLEESEHLSHLIDNILDFSRIDEDRKKYEFVGLDLDKLTREFLKSIREMIKETGFDIRYSCPDKLPVIQADRNAILQVLYNLVDNAIKFSGKSRLIDISLVSEKNELQLTVKDYGIGIAAKDQGKVFERFYRGEEPQRLGIKGSGIGLTIVRRIVEDHKGHLTLDSKPDEGSTFTVGIPVS